MSETFLKKKKKKCNTAQLQFLQTWVRLRALADWWQYCYFPFYLQANPTELYLDLGSKMYPKTARFTKADCKPELWCFEACVWWAEHPDSETMNQGAVFIPSFSSYYISKYHIRGSKIETEVEICFFFFLVIICVAQNLIWKSNQQHWEERMKKDLNGEWFKIRYT